MVESRLEGGEGWPSMVCVWWAVTFQGEERTHEEAARGTSVAAAAGAHGRQRGGEAGLGPRLTKARDARNTKFKEAFAVRCQLCTCKTL